MSYLKDIFNLKDKTIKTINDRPILLSRFEYLLTKISFDPNIQLDSQIGNYYYSVISSVKLTDNDSSKKLSDLLITICRYIYDNKLNSNAKVKAALRYVQDKDIIDNINEFEKLSGVGIEYTKESLKEAIEFYISDKIDLIKKDRYVYYDEILSKQIKLDFEFAYYPELRKILELLIKDIIGNKTKEDKAAIKLYKKKLKASKKKVQVVDTDIKKNNHNVNNTSSSINNNDVDLNNNNLLDIINSGRKLDMAQNSQEILDIHNKITNGKIITRFPPEPNGYLHVGHCKAMNFNFKVAKENNGHCIMRFDDTNPEAEKQVYIDSILDNLSWLNHIPYKITYSSDYFDELYNLAIKLIKLDKAYVCFQTGDEIKKSREHKPHPLPSQYRNTSIEQNLKLFHSMKIGLYNEGECTLRMKGDLKSPNPNMWDLVAYRIKYVAHPKTKDKWCIYPSYDYTHCIVDSLENITHSLCTLEFENRRESYYWLLDVLNLYKPNVWEYSRLNIEHNVLSKRKLKELVFNNHVSNWDDPRLLTIDGLKRRGFTNRALTNFCNAIGVSRNSTIFPRHILDYHIRNDLDINANRIMSVLKPLKVEIINLEQDIIINNIPCHPKDSSKGLYKAILSKIIYIEQDDFRDNTNNTNNNNQAKNKKKFYGLELNKTVLLKYIGCITCTNIIYDNNNKIEKIQVKFEYPKEGEKLPKGKLHWVSEKDSLKIETRLYNVLFTKPNVSKDYLDYINPESEIIIQDSLINYNGIKDTIKINDKYQFERIGYFSVDKSSNIRLKKLRFNRTVTLKDSK